MNFNIEDLENKLQEIGKNDLTESSLKKSAILILFYPDPGCAEQNGGEYLQAGS